MSAVEIDAFPDQPPVLDLVPEPAQVAAGQRPPRTWGPKWAAAMVRAQRDFPAIIKNADVEVATAKGKYSYSYAPLDLVIDRVQVVLGNCGLAVLQDAWTESCEMIDEDGKLCPGTAVTVLTTILHESGEFREFHPLTHRGIDLRIHDLGSLISYLRRYSILVALRLAPANEDDDGKNEMERPQGKPAPPRRPQGVTTTNPRGDAARNADQKKVALYVAEMSKAGAKQDDLSIRQLWDEVKADQDTAIVVWDTLKKQHGDVFGFIDSLLKPAKSTGSGRRS